MHAMFEEMKNATSSFYVALVGALEPLHRGTVVEAMDQLRSKLHGILNTKLASWYRISYYLIGVFYCATSGLVYKAKYILQMCISEFEAADPAKIHRVANRLLSPLMESGRQLREWLASNLA